MEKTELSLDLDELEKTLCLDGTIPVDETFEELEQSIISLLSDDPSELAFSPISQPNSQNDCLSDLKKCSSFDDPGISGNPENCQSFPHLSPIALFKESGPKRYRYNSPSSSSPLPTKKLNIGNVQLLSNSPTRRSPRKVCAALDLKENIALLQNDTPIELSTHRNITPIKNNLTDITAQVIFNRNSNSLSVENKNAWSGSPKLPLRSKNNEEIYNAVENTNCKHVLPQNLSSVVHSHVTNVADKSAISCLSNENKSSPPELTPFLKCEDSDSSQIIINPLSLKSFHLNQLEQNISSKCGEVPPINSQELQLKEQSGQESVMSDCSNTESNFPVKCKNAAIEQLPCVEESLKSNTPTLIRATMHENPHSICTANNGNTAKEQSFKIPSSGSNLDVPVVCIDSMDDEAVLGVLIDGDEIEIINIDSDLDEDTLLGSEENTDNFKDSENNNDEMLDDTKQSDKIANYLKNQMLSEVHCKYNPAHSVPANGGTNLNNELEHRLPHNNTVDSMTGDKKDTEDGGVCLHKTFLNLRVKSSHEGKVADSLITDDEDRDSVMLVVEELKCDDTDTESGGKTGVKTDKSSGTVSEKRDNILKVDLPVKKGGEIVESKLTFASGKINRTGTIPKSEANAQNRKQAQPEVKTIKEITPPLSGSSQPGNSNASENTVQAKKISKPFKSEDPEENKDINHPEWENMKMLTTDEQRYEEVRNRWKSNTVPNPNRDLTFHSFRKRKVKAQAGSTAKSNAKQGQKRAADDNLEMPVAKRTRTKTVRCTDLIDGKIASTEKQYSKDKQTVQQIYTAESESLSAIRSRAEQNLRVNGYNFQPYFNSGYSSPFQMLESGHRNARNELLMKCDSRIKAAQSARDRRLNALHNARQEIEKFCKFYKGLHKSKDGDDDDPIRITENQMKELNEMENVFQQFSRYYKG